VTSDERFCPTCGCDVFECGGAGLTADGFHRPCTRDFPDPPAVVLSSTPPSRAALGWFFLAVLVGMMFGWAAFF
jgi:hypothetical protein